MEYSLYITREFSFSISESSQRVWQSHCHMLLSQMMKSFPCAPWAFRNNFQNTKSSVWQFMNIISYFRSDHTALSGKRLFMMGLTSQSPIAKFITLNSICSPDKVWHSIMNLWPMMQLEKGYLLTELTEYYSARNPCPWYILLDAM